MTTEKSQTDWFEELIKLVFLLVMAVAVMGFYAAILYGIVVIIFKYAFGVHLPNPFEWF